MKLTCTCGHPNHLHFAGTGNCHAAMDPSVVLQRTKTARCVCERFVPVPNPEKRKDTQ